ncbi:MAG: CBS domain-containing protein [Planctomycetota bacterium]
MPEQMLAYPGVALASVPGPGLLFGLLLAAAIAGGHVARALRIPRVVGYLVAGAIFKLVLCWLLDIGADGEAGADAAQELAAAVSPLKAVKDLGLGIILFSIGGVFEARHLKAVGGKLLKISLAESGLTFLLVFAGATGVGFFVAQDAPLEIVLAFAALLGFASIATAPAATMSVLHEYDAKGPVTDMILSLTAVNNVLCIVTFHVCFLGLAASGALGSVALSPGGVWLDMAATTIGSVALGLLLGGLISIIHSKLPTAETILILVATLIVCGAGEGWLLEQQYLSYNFLLMALCTGATFANAAIDPDRIQDMLRMIARPILVGFFVIAGFQLHLADLADLRLCGIAYVVCRLAGKLLGTHLGQRWAGESTESRAHLGTALLCQAAVVIGLADFVTAYWDHDWAHRFATILLGSVVIFETSGPLLTKWVVKQAGEVKAVTLLRRVGPTLGSASAVRLTLQSLVRSLGLLAIGRPSGSGALLVRHVMRSNVKCLPTYATFDEVLHFVEQSRFNQFPIVDEKRDLVGVIHFSQIREIIYSPFLARAMTAVDFAHPTARPVHAEMTLAEAMAVFQEGDVGSLPVVAGPESRRVVGIVEQRDILRELHEGSAGVPSV